MIMRPCERCGASEKNKWGDCRPCKKTYSVKFRMAHPDKAKAAVAKYRAAHPDKAKAYHAKYRKAHPEKGRIKSHNHRALKRANGGKLSQGLAATLFKRQRGLCVCCKQPLGDNYQLDHIMPLKLGGKNEDSNIQLLTATCNLQKSARHPVEFMQSRGLLL